MATTNYVRLSSLPTDPSTPTSGKAFLFSDSNNRLCLKTDSAYLIRLETGGGTRVTLNDDIVLDQDVQQSAPVEFNKVTVSGDVVLSDGKMLRAEYFKARDSDGLFCLNTSGEGLEIQDDGDVILELAQPVNDDASYLIIDQSNARENFRFMKYRQSGTGEGNVYSVSPNQNDYDFTMGPAKVVTHATLSSVGSFYISFPGMDTANVGNLSGGYQLFISVTKSSDTTTKHSGYAVGSFASKPPSTINHVLGSSSINGGTISASSERLFVNLDGSNGDIEVTLLLTLSMKTNYYGGEGPMSALDNFKNLIIEAT